jgi:hypothetical protein
VTRNQDYLPISSGLQWPHGKHQENNIAVSSGLF